MNRKVILILSAGAALALGSACVVLLLLLNSQRQRERAAAESVAAEAAARAADAERLSEAERERSRVEKQNKELGELASRLREQESKQSSNVSALVQQLKGSGTNSADDPLAALGGGKGMGEMFEKMMKDPAMKEMIRSQQKSMMKTMYGSLFKELNLPADQQKKLTDLLLDAQMSGVESAGDLFKGEGEARTNAVNAITERQKATQAQIKALLGDEKYAQYEDYQKTLSDRMVLNQFQQQSAGTETELRDEQVQGLMALIKEERTKTPPIIDDDQNKTAENLQKMFNSELFDKQMQWQEDLNKRVLARAGGLLTPEQLKEYTEFQESQYNMMKLGMKMAREMFKGKEGPK